MPHLFRFSTDDLFVNRLTTNPRYEVTFYSGSAYINDSRYGGANAASGSLSLYELNVGREITSSIVVTGDNKYNLIHPFVVKDGTMSSFNSIGTTEYNEAEYGTVLTSSYPLTSSVQRELIAAASLPSTTINSTDTFFDARKKMIALGNTITSYKVLSPLFEYSSSNPHVDKPLLTDTVNMISIPSIFFDSGIKPGTVDLKFFYTGTLMAQAIDEQRNGELISTMGSTSGSVVGLALYDQGFLLLTSSQALASKYAFDDYTNDGNQEASSWLYFGAYSGSNSQNYATSSLYSVAFRGTNNVPTMTMFAHAGAGNINNSQNPTWISASHKGWRNGITSTSGTYIEPNDLTIKNTVQSQYCRYEGEFQKQVFVSKIGIFDDDKNLIGVAKLANPVLKRDEDSLTFKLKIDF
jgi:hypothetical protein